MSGYGSYKVTCGDCGDSYEASGVVGDIRAERWLRDHKKKHCTHPYKAWPLSECGHHQTGPTEFEITNCPEIIVRVCSVCKAELYWSVNHWKKVVQSNV